MPSVSVAPGITPPLAKGGSAVISAGQFTGPVPRVASIKRGRFTLRERPQTQWLGGRFCRQFSNVFNREYAACGLTSVHTECLFPQSSGTLAPFRLVEYSPCLLKMYGRCSPLRREKMHHTSEMIDDTRATISRIRVTGHPPDLMSKSNCRTLAMCTPRMTQS